MASELHLVARRLNEFHESSDAWHRAGQMLDELKSVTKALPQTVSLGSQGGFLAKTFTKHPSNLDNEGIWYSFNKIWERAFHSQKPIDDQTAHVLRGKYGLQIVIEFVEFYKDTDGMTEADLELMCGKLEHLLKIVASVSPPKAKRGTVSANAFYSSSSKASGSGSNTAARSGTKRSHDNNDVVASGDDADPTPLKRPRKSIMSDKTADDVLGITRKNKKDTEREKAKAKAAKGKGKGKEKVTVANARKRKRAYSGSSGSSGEEVDRESTIAVDADEEDNAPVGVALDEKLTSKQEWAYAHFTRSPAFDKKQRPVWLWTCIFCGRCRTTTRSSVSAKEFAVPPESYPAKWSNLTGHLGSDCKMIPEKHTYEQWLARRERGDVDGVSDFEPPARQGTLMQRWAADATAAPAKRQRITKRRFREVFVKGIIEDDLPFTFGEKGGMRKVFTYVLPDGYKVPSRKMVRRDLDMLHAALVSKRVRPNFDAHTGRIATLVDGWGSKSSVYSFIGVIASFIDKNWNLIEYPLDLIPLDEDHSGKVYGKEIFRCLRQHGISKKFIANTLDNTSANGVMNRALTKRGNKRHPHLKLDAAKIDIGCATHVLNLSCQDILSGVGAAPSTADVDLHVEAKAQGLPMEQYNKDADEDLHEEEALQKAELEAELKAGFVDDEDELEGPSDSDDSSAEESDAVQDDDGDESWADDEVEETEQPARRKSKKSRRRRFTPVNQIHAIVVDVMRSSIRRHRFRRFVRRTCPKAIRDLMLIRSMRVRWNSVHAELLRAKQLRPAINAYLESLPNGLTGKKKTAALAKQKKWTVSVAGWEMIDTMIIILQPFEQGTRDLSMSGVPTLCMVLPIFKSLEEHLQAQISTLTESFKRAVDEFKIVDAVKLGLDKLSHYLAKAVDSDYHLLAVVLNPQLRLQYFEDDTRWAPEVPVRARALLESLCQQYSKKAPVASALAAQSTQPATTSSSAPSGSLYMRSIQRQTSMQDAATPTWTLALESYLNGAYPFPENKGADYILSWWSAYGSKFTPLDAIARDVLAIHGVSVPVERLFSSSGLTLRDNRARLTATTAGKTIITKEWLKRGFGDGVDYLEGVSIWEKDSGDESE